MAPFSKLTTMEVINHTKLKNCLVPSKILVNQSIIPSTSKYWVRWTIINHLLINHFGPVGDICSVAHVCIYVTPRVGISNDSECCWFLMGRTADTNANANCCQHQTKLSLSRTIVAKSLFWCFATKYMILRLIELRNTKKTGTFSMQNCIIASNCGSNL